MDYPKICKACKDFFLSLLFEKNELLAAIENMSAEEFLLATRASSHPYALLCYKDPLVRTLIWNMKYRKNKKCFHLAGKLLYKRISDMHIADLLIIPVPLSAKRFKERGYNQVELMLRTLPRFFEVRTDIIARKHTTAQTSLSRKERLQNLHEAFAVIDKDSVQERIIIVVDDVITTGATTAEISKVLKAAGAKKVITLALAH